MSKRFFHKSLHSFFKQHLTRFRSSSVNNSKNAQMVLLFNSSNCQLNRSWEQWAQLQRWSRGKLSFGWPEPGTANEKKRRKFLGGSGAFNMRSQIHHLNFHRRKVCLSIFFPWKIFFPAIFDFHFRKNPCFRDEFQALLTTTLWCVFMQQAAVCDKGHL